MAKYYETISGHWKYLNYSKINFLRISRFIRFHADIQLTRNMGSLLKTRDRECFDTGILNFLLNLTHNLREFSYCHSFTSDKMLKITFAIYIYHNLHQKNDQITKRDQCSRFATPFLLSFLTTGLPIAIWKARWNRAGKIVFVTISV